MKDLIYKHRGNVRRIAKEIGCTPMSVYVYLELHQDLQEHRKKADLYCGDYELESAYDVLEKVMERVDEDASSALRAAQTVVSKARSSRYYSDPTGTEKGSATLAYMTEIAAENAEMAKKNAKLEAEIEKLKNG